ncbi:MAG TPA: hypothetical protein DEB39_16505 [Planctomycetaceae bacterium]|nr:hypothetical protein [Planctomycetaceae bacterium]
MMNLAVSIRPGFVFLSVVFVATLVYAPIRGQESKPDDRAAAPIPATNFSAAEWKERIEKQFEVYLPISGRYKPQNGDRETAEELLRLCVAYLGQDLSDKDRLWGLRRQAVVLETLTVWKPTQYYGMLKDAATSLESYRERFKDVDKTLQPIRGTLLRTRYTWLGSTDLRESSRVDIDELVGDLHSFVQDYPGTKANEAVTVLINIVKRFPQAKRDDTLLRIARPLSRLYLESRVVEDRIFGMQLLGLINRIELVGNEMTLAGYEQDETPFDPASLKGKVVLVDFWETACLPCMQQMPRLIELHEKYRDRGVEFVGVACDPNPATTVKFLKEKNIFDGKVPGWPHIVDNMAAVKKEPTVHGLYGVYTFPTMFLIGKDGRVISTATNILTLENEIEAALAVKIDPRRKPPIRPETIPSPPKAN